MIVPASRPSWTWSSSPSTPRRRPRLAPPERLPPASPSCASRSNGGRRSASRPRRSRGGTIGGTVETNGVIAEDEGRVRAVERQVRRLHRATPRRPHRPGACAGDEPLLSVYSPDLVATERELPARRRERPAALRAPPSGEAASNARALLEATRERLRLWDIPDAEIARVERDRARFPAT